MGTHDIMSLVFIEIVTKRKHYKIVKKTSSIVWSAVVRNLTPSFCPREN